MNTSTLILLSSLLVACGGDEPAPAAAPAAAPAPKAEAPALKPWRDALTDADIQKYGERVFMAKGSNTCNDCHGKDGKKERLEQAADLTNPSSWRLNKVYGDDSDKANTALAYLLSKGGKNFNQSFATDNPDAGWDWAKAEANAYDIQMFGVTQSSTQAAIKKIRKELKKSGYSMDKADMTAFGTKSVISYLASTEAK